MRFWRHKKTPKQQVEAVFRKMANAAFPGGEEQIERETSEVVLLLQDRISHDDARKVLVHSKGRLLIASQSANDDNTMVQRSVDSILLRWPEILDRSSAEEVALFAYGRLLDQLRSVKQGSSTSSWTEMSKEEALLVARITAYRVARHQGRTRSDVQNAYDLDPVLFILELASDYLTGDLYTQKKKIKTRSDALERSLAVARLLALVYQAEKTGAGASRDPEEIDRMAKEEIELTLSLLREPDRVGSYTDCDPSEARAAGNLDVPFYTALRLGEIGLLRDPPGPTDSRRRILSRVLGQPEGS